MSQRRRIPLLAALSGCFIAASGSVAAQPDLIPIVTAPMSASVGVQNVGDSASPATHLTIECTAFGQPVGGCPDAPDLGVYENPAFPNVGVVAVPALQPGETFNHDLTVWDDMVWPVGTFVFDVQADAGNAVAESNEMNNTTQTSYTELPMPGVAEQPPLPLQARPGSGTVPGQMVLPQRREVAPAAPLRKHRQIETPAKAVPLAPRRQTPGRSTN